MSGIEVAGLVLGAFPLAIEALDRYREVATRAGLFYQIKLKHRQCRNRLEREKLVYTGNLKQLLLPMVVDDEKITEMLSNPGGPSWKDEATSELLKTRLKDAHNAYMDCIENMDGVMKGLIHELALDSNTITKSLKAPKLSTKERLNNVMTKTGLEYQAYKIKFSNGESARNNLFKELSECNKSLEQLLGISDKETQLLQERQANTVASAIDSAICNFWVNANRLFEALATAWQCSCQGQHSTRLLLQHRETKTSDFKLLFAKAEDSKWRIRETKITEEDELAPEAVRNKSKNVAFQAADPHQPPSAVKLPRKSALKSSMKTTTTTMVTHRPAPSVTLNTGIATLPEPTTKPIENLCDSLNDVTASCYGYLPHEDCRYYVYKVSDKNAATFNSITLDQIFRGQISKPPNRRQRLALSFILSSSFLQLLNTPWLSVSWAKSDITFMMDPAEPGTYALDRPHLVYSDLAARGGQTQSDEDITKSLRQLGIVLLELCFGRLLEDQPCRKKFPSVDDEAVKFTLDLAAALDWLQEVEGEEGPDYASAVGWCLVATRPGRWRQEMLRKVVKPLEGYHQFFVSKS
ncbi:uncharacterized protein F4822DRAFT_199745 [Hypoxylon trugodes]|uniref:uncharacterized protein n=1 Tax=Hypoxylon trugodes TaxID=326681 RepID=UPI002197685F|nr:uncharacterized protein F4822DRAFT_199745 [Hypoxylon trugodes]KAI1389422.1 hypothetical protein F4822DRAFT_199745 [Hypoxylon trugodes]